MPADLPDWIPDRRIEIGDRIRIHRERCGLTQEQLAEAAGVHRSTVQRVERGERDTWLSHLLLIAHALDVPLADLVK